MSVKGNPCSGYVLEAEKLLTALNADDRVAASLLIDTGDWKGFQGFLETHLPPVFPKPDQTFIFGHDDNSDDLEPGKMYCLWDESQLYAKVEKYELKVLEKGVGMKPQFTNWTIWG
jgi:hypothetical protein